MEVKGQLILAPEPLTCQSRKQKERMAELQERRRSLQAMLSTRLAELRRICLQEAELTGAVPSDFPLEAGEKPPNVGRRGGGVRHGNRKCRVEDEDGQRSKPRKTLFSAALRKHSDSGNSTHTQTHNHNGKRTVHRGCHTDDTMRSESSSASDSTGNDNDAVAQCRPLLGCSAGSPVEVLNQNKTNNSVLGRTEHRDTNKPPALPPSQPPPPPPRSQDSSDAGREGGCRASRQSSGSNGILTRAAPPEEEGGVQQVVPLRPNGATVSRGTNAAGLFWSAETSKDRGSRTSGGGSEGGGRGAGRVGGYSEVLLDYVWEKQRQLQRQQSQPVSQPLHGGGSALQPPGAPPTYRGHHGDHRRVTVTRTKSCGPFLAVQQNQCDVNKRAPPTIQPDPHPHLLPPRPPQLPPQQDSQLEEATRSLHKALALEGLRDWYLRNTLGSSNQTQASGKLSAGANNTKPSAGLKVQAGGSDALLRRRMASGVVQQSVYESHHYAGPRHKQTLPHSATFHGHPLHGRSADGSPYQDSFPSQKQEVPLRDLVADQPSPGTLV